MNPRERATRLVETTRRRLWLRRSLRLTGVLLAVGAGLGLVPLLLAKLEPSSRPVVTIFLVDLALAIGLALVLSAWRPPRVADAARALDRDLGASELFLTASTSGPGAIERSALGDAFVARLAREVERASPRRAVPLGGTTTLRVLAVLLSVDILLAITPHRRAEPEPWRDRLESWLDRAEEDTNTTDAERRVIDEVRAARNREGAHEIVRKTLDREESARTALPRDAAALARAIRRGDLRRAAEIAAAALTTDVPADLREDIAKALEEQGRSSADEARRKALDALARSAREGGAGTGLAAGLSDLAARGPRADDPATRLQRLLLTLDATLGAGGETAPTEADRTEPAPFDPVTTPALDERRLRQWPERQRAVMERYFRRRASRRAASSR